VQAIIIIPRAGAGQTVAVGIEEQTVREIIAGILSDADKYRQKLLHGTRPAG
jgi:hypothetical protein